MPTFTDDARRANRSAAIKAGKKKAALKRKREASRTISLMYAVTVDLPETNMSFDLDLRQLVRGLDTARLEGVRDAANKELRKRRR